MTETRQTVWTVVQEQDTVRLAELLADWATPVTVLALDGDLGAGKTRFSQAFAKGIGVRGIVNSPTFTIIKEYKVEICCLISYGCLSNVGARRRTSSGLTNIFTATG